MEELNKNGFVIFRTVTKKEGEMVPECSSLLLQVYVLTSHLCVLTACMGSGSGVLLPCTFWCFFHCIQLS